MLLIRLISMKINVNILLLLAILLMTTSNSCVSHRKKGQTSALGRAYHNTTAKYNGYFNANELLQESLLAIDQSYRYNYNTILPVFSYNAAENVDAEKPKLDKAIEKVSVVITSHRVSHWTDDCYLLLAKAQYIKKDYETAENSYRFFLEEFDPLKNSLKIKLRKENAAKEKKKEQERLKKERKKAAEQKIKERKRLQKERAAARKNKKKSKSTPATEKKQTETIVNIPAPATIEASESKQKPINEGTWLFPHYSVYWEGAIWAGKNLIERGKPYEAEQLFRRVENEPSRPDHLRGELYAAYADLYIKTGKFDRAIPALKSAIEFTKAKKLKARYAYILGQLYQRDGRIISSNEYFTQCVKLKPSYDLSFHAKMNLLINEASEGASQQEVAASLEKFLKDPKNKDYQGELYYALALINLKQNRKPQAVDQLFLSLRSPNVTNSQKADTYKQLADLYFDDQDYLNAKLYYDSTMNFLAKSDERRGPVSKTVANLEAIAAHIQNIALQDSLLKISALSVKDKRSLAIQLKNAKKAKVAEPSPQRDLRSRFTELEASSMNPFEREFERRPETNKKSTSSNFFAYDQRSINRGRSEFEQTWGEIRLEDNWRRKNKNSFSINEVAETKVIEETDSLETDLALVLAGIPETPEEKKEAHRKIAESLFELGLLFREKLENYKKSSASFTSLLEKYPDSEKRVDAMYYMYLNCIDQFDDPCANTLKDKITYEYPGSHYSKILTDPEYVKAILSRRDEISNDYKKAFGLYKSSQFAQAFDALQILKNKIKPPHVLQAKVALLSAFCIGNLQGKDVYINSLKEVVANYPSTPEEIKAKEILRFLKGDQDAFIEVRQSELDKTNFKLEDDKMHFLLIVLFEPPDKVVDKAKISISDYNQNYHRSENLKMTSLELDIDLNQPLILIRKFDNKREAMKYYNSLQRKTKEFITEFDNWEAFPITQNNYREILRIKTLSEYKSFFKKNYLEAN
jgi:tetratricopeptide (TPR) repeat protein